MPDPYSFDSILNFRDFGGQLTCGGTRIAPGQLFRSASFFRASDADLARLAALDIDLKVDLRHHPERMRQPSRWPDNHNTEFLALDDETPAGLDDDLPLAPHEMFMRYDMHSAADARAYMKMSYAARPDDPVFRDIFRQTLKFMADDGGRLVIHCAAGKDRTGTLAAIILHVLGADEATIFEDYMATRMAVNVDKLLDIVQPKVEAKYQRSFNRNALRTMFGVEPDFLRASLDAMGDRDAYCRNTLGLSEADRHQIQARYCTPA